MESEFPSNTNEPKGSQLPRSEIGKGEPKKTVKKVTTGTVKTRKKPLGRRFMDTFTGDDSKSVLQYVFFDIMIPSAKDMIADAVSQGIERKLFGEVRSTSRRGRSAGHTAYSRISSGSRDIFRRDDPRGPSRSERRSRNMNDWREIILETRPEAVEVIDQMYELLSKYEVVTVADLYDLLGESGNFTDDRYGWTDIRGADVVRIRDGYLLDLPTPVQLD